MKKFLVVLLVAILSAAAIADPDDLLLTQRNHTDTGNNTRIPPHPTTNWGVLSYDPSVLLPSWLTFGAGFTVTSGVVDVSITAPSWSDITGKPTTLAGFGITDAYPLSGNPSGFLSSISSGQVISALGYTPYNAANPSSYVDQSGARSSISLTTNGSGAATYNSGTGALNIPTPAVSPFNFGLPSTRTLAVSTDYQASDTSKAAVIYPSYACTNSTTVLAASACTIQVRISNTSVTCSTGTVYYTQSLTVNLGLLITQNSTNPVPIFLPIGAHFIFCQTAGTFTISAVEQTAS